MQITDITCYPVWGGFRNFLFTVIDTDDGIRGAGESGLTGRELAVTGTIERGPIVYCLEQADQGPSIDLLDVAIDTAGRMEASWRGDLLAGALERWRGELVGEIEKQKYLQWIFFEQWLALKEYANGLGVRVIGDIPIFVALDSADVWANPGLFHFDKELRPTVQSGVPPDYFS